VVVQGVFLAQNFERDKKMRQCNKYSKQLRREFSTYKRKCLWRPNVWCNKWGGVGHVERICDAHEKREVEVSENQ